jgi:hypothetical protein
MSRNFCDAGVFAAAAHAIRDRQNGIRTRRDSVLWRFAALSRNRKMPVMVAT